MTLSATLMLAHYRLRDKKTETYSPRKKLRRGLEARERWRRQRGGGPDVRKISARK